MRVVYKISSKGRKKRENKCTVYNATTNKNKETQKSKQTKQNKIN